MALGIAFALKRCESVGARKKQLDSRDPSERAHVAKLWINPLAITESLCASDELDAITSRHPSRYTSRLIDFHLVFTWRFWFVI
jgi:hypothetical protein